MTNERDAAFVESIIDLAAAVAQMVRSFKEDKMTLVEACRELKEYDDPWEIMHDVSLLWNFVDA